MVISVVVIAVSLCWQNLVHGGDAFSLLRKDNGDCLFCPLKSSAKNASHNHQRQARNHFPRRQRPAIAIAPFLFCDCIYEIHRWAIAHKLFLRACFVSVPKCTPCKNQFNYALCTTQSNPSFASMDSLRPSSNEPWQDMSVMKATVLSEHKA